LTIKQLYLHALRGTEAICVLRVPYTWREDPTNAARAVAAHVLIPAPSD